MSDFSLELKNLTKNFGQTKIIQNLSISINKGERVAVIGPNGAGKSTLFNLISGQFSPTSGQILLNNEQIQGKTPYQINRLGLARSFQITNLFSNLTVFETLCCSSLYSLGHGYNCLKMLNSLSDVNDRAGQIMHSLRLEHKSNTHCNQLTYAEQRALEIGVTLGSGAQVLLLDEPTAGMSNSETTQFLDLILEVTKGKTLLTVEHDMGVVFGLADKIAVLVYGEIIAFDTPQKIRSNEAVKEAYLGAVP
jgi:branched-chain amino acid transport system ATP-binding protein